jgi:hypothetical protein
MRTLVLAAIFVLGTAAQAADSDCAEAKEAKRIEILSENESFTSCEVELLMATQLKHLQITGQTCSSLDRVKLISVNWSVKSSAAGSLLEAVISVVNKGFGQPADSYLAIGAYDGPATCSVQSVKLLPLDYGLPSPVATPYPYRHH